MVPRGTPAAAATATAASDHVQIFNARPGHAPLALKLDLAPGMAVEQRLQARFDALALAPAFGPAVSFNVLHDSARVTAVAVERSLAVLDFAVLDGEWGLHDRSVLRSFLEQVVFSATDEKSISEVRLTQNGGADAVIAVEDAIITYRAPLTRELVAPYARQDHMAAYYARPGDGPVAIFLAGAGLGATPEERTRSRLVALEMVRPSRMRTLSTSSPRCGLVCGRS